MWRESTPRDEKWDFFFVSNITAVQSLRLNYSVTGIKWEQRLSHNVGMCFFPYFVLCALAITVNVSSTYIILHLIKSSEGP